MKTRLIRTRIAVMIVVTALALNSCQKEVITPKNNNQNNSNLAGKSTPVDVVAISSTVYEEFHNSIFSAQNKEGSPNLEKSGSSCETTTIDTVNKPYTKTMDYGTTGCVGNDGKVRKGQVILTFDNTDPRTINNHIVCSFNNYSVNNQQLEGTVSFHNSGFNTSGHLLFNEAINVQSTANGVTDSLTGAGLYEWVAGENSNPFSDLQFKITGSVSGSDHNGHQITATITNPLIKNYKTSGCNYYIKGTLLVRDSGQPDKTIDYGNGSCTGLETITSNGQTTVKQQ